MFVSKKMKISVSQKMKTFWRPFYGRHLLQVAHSSPRNFSAPDIVNKVVHLIFFFCQHFHMLKIISTCSHILLPIQNFFSLKMISIGQCVFKCARRYVKQQHYLYFNMCTKKHSKLLPKKKSVYHEMIIGMKLSTKKVCNKSLI